MHLIGKETEDQILESLNWTIRQARKSKFYAPRLKEDVLISLDDVASLPFTSKHDLRDWYPDGFLSVGFDELWEYHESFGTTGDPVPGMLTAKDGRNYVDQIRHCRVDFDSHDVVLIRFPYAISLPAHVTHATAQAAGACVIPVSSRTTVSPYPRVVSLLTKLPVTVICGLPLEMLLIAETARQLGIDLRLACPSLRALVVAGEVVSDEKKALLEEMWGVSVHVLYGATEVGNLAQTCTRGSLHLCGRHYYFEVAKESNGQPAGYEEEGRLIVSTLTKEAMPILRYDTGDMVRVSKSETCGCERIDPVINVLGRSGDTINYGGRSIHTEQLDRAAIRLARLLGGHFWYCVLEKDSIVVRVDSREADTEKVANSRLLLDEVQSSIGVPIKIDCVPLGELINRSLLFDLQHVGKPSYVLDHRERNTHEARLPGIYRVPEAQ